VVLNVGVLLHCEGGSRGLRRRRRRRRRLESDGVYGVYEDGRLRPRLVFERGRGC
jgi:hypothetical protein